MARKTAQYKVTDEGRDKGKTFLITEMSAKQTEDWAARAILGLIGSGVQLPDNYHELGMAGFAELGIKSLPTIRYDLLKPLLDEMFETIQFVGDPTKAYATTRPLLDDDIEEVTTRLNLRLQWGKLHMDFSSAAVQSLGDQVKSAAGKLRVTKTSRG
jgi:hypothetical protein